jgi:putative tricarboxylic transport membrane protein
MISRDVIIGLAITVVGAVYWRAAGTLPKPLLQTQVGPEVFPELIALALVILGLILVLGPLLRRLMGKRLVASPGEATETELAPPDVRTIVLVFLGLVLYTLVYEWLGFLVATILFMAYEIGVMEISLKRWLWALPAIVLLPIVLYVLFVKVLGVSLAEWGGG